MAKKVVSVAPHKKKSVKPINNKGKKLKTLFRKLSNYMKSDSYMYSLLASPKLSRALPSASSGKGSYEPNISKNEKTWLQEVEEYLKCDCYMYSPLCNPQKGLKQIEETSRPHDQMEKTTQPDKRIAVKHVLVRETVKRVVLQNGSSYASGKELLQKELDKMGGKTNSMKGKL